MENPHKSKENCWFAFPAYWNLIIVVLCSSSLFAAMCLCVCGGQFLSLVSMMKMTEKKKQTSRGKGRRDY